MPFMSKEMRLHFHNAVGYLTFPMLDELPFVRHAFSTRTGGVSTGEFSSMNLSFGRGDKEENVLRNYQLFCNAAGFDYNGLVASAQDHNTVVRRVGAAERGIGIWRPRDKTSVDALITDEPGIVLVTYYADCVPLYFVDPVRRAIGLAHAGWRGSLNRIGARTVEEMQRQFGSNPGDIVAAIGPSIGPCCYEVDEPVAAQFAGLSDLQPDAFLHPRPERPGKYLLDLWEENRRVLLAAGIAPQKITVTDVCSCCNSGLLFSHRATGGKRGGMAAMMSLQPDV